MTIDIFEPPESSAEENMKRDSRYLDEVSFQTRPLLNFYAWEKPSLTYGYFIKPFDCLNIDEVRSRGIDVAQRPTGGGIVMHWCDLAFSLVVPSTHSLYCAKPIESYQKINAIVLQAVVTFLGKRSPIDLLESENSHALKENKKFCMAHPTRYDVMLDGKKIGGAAQRRTREGLLHQGSICLRLPEVDELRSLINMDVPVAETMGVMSCSLIEKNAVFEEERKKLKQHLIDEFSMCAFTGIRKL